MYACVFVHVCIFGESWTLSEIIDKRKGEGLEMVGIGAFLFFCVPLVN